jgi:hypothetical protein
MTPQQTTWHVILFAQSALCLLVEEFLDDPVNTAMEMDDDYDDDDEDIGPADVYMVVAEHANYLKMIARDLKIDWDTLLKESAENDTQYKQLMILVTEGNKRIDAEWQDIKKDLMKDKH